MFLFKNKYERELDILIDRMEMDMSNNYKDNAQSDLKDYESRLNELKNQGLLKDKASHYYDQVLGTYRERMKGYSHKDQKPYWTKKD